MATTWRVTYSVRLNAKGCDRKTDAIKTLSSTFVSKSSEYYYAHFECDGMEEVQFNVPNDKSVLLFISWNKPE